MFEGAPLFKKWDKAKDSAPQCVNCQEYHPANYKGCTYYQNFKRNIQNKRPSFPRPASSQQIPLQNGTRNNLTYADAARLHVHSPQPKNPNTPLGNGAIDHDPNPFSIIINQVIKFVIDLIKPHIESIKTVFLNHLSTMFTNSP